MQPGDVPTGDDSLYSLVDEITELVQHGAEDEVESFLSAHADSASRLRELLPAIRALAQLPGQPRQQVGGLAQLGGACRTLGDYRILRELGRGGMGIVYEAEQISLGPKVALKVLADSAVRDERQLERFKNEAIAASQLKHPGIVRVLAIGEDGGVYYLAMDYVEGTTLAKVIARRAAMYHTDVEPAGAGSASLEVSAVLGPSDKESSPTKRAISDVVRSSIEASFVGDDWFRRVADVGIAVAEALDHAHSVGIVHRDVKPSNLLVNAAGTVLVTDFGLAQIETDVSLTVTGEILGTLRYMSPEQARGDKRFVDHRTDIYSLGITLYEMLTLQHAYSETDRQHLLTQVLDTKPKPPRRLDSSIPQDLETIVLKAIAKGPEQRYQTCEELAQDLRRYLTNKPVRARRPSVIDNIHEWAGRNRNLVTASLLVLTIASVAGAVIVRERELRLYEQRLRQQQVQLRRHQDDLLARNREIARAHRYVSDMNRAWRAWHRTSIKEMHGILSQWHPQPGESDLRGFEWYYLRGLCDCVPQPIGRHDGPAYFIADSPRGASFATAGVDGIRIWGTETGLQLRHLTTHAGEVNWVCYAPDGSILASASDDHTVRLWDTETWQEIRSISMPSAVLAAEFSGDGRFLAVAERSTGDGKGRNHISLYDTDGWSNRLNVEMGQDRLDGICCSSDGLLLGTAAGKTVTIRRISDGQVQWKFQSLIALHCVAIDPLGESVVAGGHDGKVYCWRLDRSGGTHELDAAASSIRSVAFVNGGKTLVTSSQSGLSSTWYGRFTETTLPEQDRSQPHLESLWCARTSLDNRYLLTTDHHGNVFRHDLYVRLNHEPTQLRQVRGENGPRFTFLDNGRRAARFRDGAILTRDLASGHDVVRLPVDTTSATAFSASPDGQQLALATSGGVQIYDAGSGHLMFSWSAEEVSGSRDAFHVGRLTYSPDGELLSPSGPGIGVLFLKARTGQRVAQQDRPVDHVEVVSWAPDGARLLVMHPDGKLQVWSSSTGELLTIAEGYWTGIWSPDGRFLAGLRVDGTAMVWDGDSYQELSTWIAHVDGGADIVYSPDGRTLATSGILGGVKLWNVATGRELVELPLEGIGRHWPPSLKFSPNGDALGAETLVDRYVPEVRIWLAPRLDDSKSN